MAIQIFKINRGIRKKESIKRQRGNGIIRFGWFNKMMMMMIYIYYICHTIPSGFSVLDSECARHISYQRKVTRHDLSGLSSEENLCIHGINFPFPPVIQGDIMSSDFIPSQPEGVYLYPLKKISDLSFFLRFLGWKDFI